MKILEIYRLLTESKRKVDEDEMGSVMLSSAPQGGALECGDNYASGDNRVPQVFGKIQKRRKKDEDNEEKEEKIQYLYRYMSIDELSSILSYSAFTRLVDFKDDSEGRVQNPAGNLPFFKSFTYKLTKDGLADYMGNKHLICLFSFKNLKRIADAQGLKLIEYKFDNSKGSIHEYEYRLFAPSTKVSVDPSAIIRKVIFTKQSGNVDLDDIEGLLLDFKDFGINAPVEFIPNVLSSKNKKISYKLDENDSIIAIES